MDRGLFYWPNHSRKTLMSKQKNKKEISWVLYYFLNIPEKLNHNINSRYFWIYSGSFSIACQWFHCFRRISFPILMFNGSIVSSLYSLSLFTFSSQSSQLKGTLRKRVTTRNIRAQCYKTFYVRNLHVFVISNNGCPWKTFPAW